MVTAFYFSDFAAIRLMTTLMVPMKNLPFMEARGGLTIKIALAVKDGIESAVDERDSLRISAMSFRGLFGQVMSHEDWVGMR